MLTLTKTIPLPLEMTEAGVIRVGGTRVTLDSVLAAFKQGATAEDIAQRYPTLQLADIYAAIAFYLNHGVEVEAYLQKRQQISEEIRRQNESRYDSAGLRERLLARRTGEKA